MSQSGYTAWNVTAGEVPTTAFWNILGSNDASFNTGNGFNDGIIIRRHLGMRQSSFAANYNIGSTDVSFTSTVIFNNVIHNIGSDYNSSTGFYTAPVNGIYLITFDCYTNNNTGRSQISWKRSGVDLIDSQHEVAGKAIIHTYNMLAGDTVSVYGTTGSPINFYSALGHNLFTVTLLWETA